MTALLRGGLPRSAAVATAPPAPPSLTAEEALRQAEAEGLTLLRSESSSTGYKGVSFNGSCKSKPYQAEVRRGGKKVYLGCYATPEEAALYYARTPEGRAAAAAPPEPPPLTAEEAVRQAEAEELTPLRSESSSTGYKGVSFNCSCKSKPYLARVWRGGKLVYLACFATAEEAALCYARSPEGQAAAAVPPAPPPMTPEEAVRQAAVEGLTLRRSESRDSGFKCVAFKGSCKSKPYQAEVRRGGKKVYLGYYTTAEEAALCYARTPEAQAAAAAAAAAPPEPPPLTAEEALRQAEAEGLTLRRSESSRTGFKCVAFNSGKKYLKPYQAQLRRGGKDMYLGCYMTAEEAALVVARASEAQAAALQPPAASSRKRKAKPEEQPPDEPADVVVILEGRFVESTYTTRVRA